MLTAAAEAWSRWRRSNRTPDRQQFVADQVNRTCHTHIQRKWVVQNSNDIEKQVGVKQNGES